MKKNLLDVQTMPNFRPILSDIHPKTSIPTMFPANAMPFTVML
jgi:hypothetical protein